MPAARIRLSAVDFNSSHCVTDDSALEPACSPKAVHLKTTQILCLSNLY